MSGEQPCCRGLGTGSKLNVSQQCALTAKEANSILGCVNRRGSRWRGVVIPLHSALIRPHLKYHVQFYTSHSPLKYRKVGACSAEGHQDGMEHLACEERLRDQVWFSLGQTHLWRDLTAAPQHLWKGQQEDGVRTFMALHSVRTRDKGLRTRGSGWM